MGTSPYQKVKLVSRPPCKQIDLKLPASYQLLWTVHIDHSHRRVNNLQIKLLNQTDLTFIN